MAKKKWMQEAVKRPGAFTAFAKKHGWSVGEAIRKVMANKDKYSARRVKQAVLARTFRRTKK